VARRRPDGEPAARWTFAVTLLPVAGVVAYAISYAVQSRFYTRLGVSPDEVGLDYRTILSGSIGLLFFVAIVTTAAVGIAALISRLRPGLRHRWSAHSVGAAVGCAALVALVVGNVLLSSAVDTRTDEVIHGRRAGTISILGVTLVSIHANICHVMAPPAHMSRLIADHLVCIGEGHGILAIFDRELRRTVTFSRAQTIVEIVPGSLSR
jgi:hypothetical protein